MGRCNVPCLRRERIDRVSGGGAVSGCAALGRSGDFTVSEEKHYAHYLGVTQFIELRYAAAIVKGVFDDSFGIYLVGSAMKRKDWRDVDIRQIISDDEFTRRFGEFVEPYDRNPFLRAFNLGVSNWMSTYSRLPIDYQVQPITKANELYPTDKGNPRNSVGLL